MGEEEVGGLVNSNLLNAVSMLTEHAREIVAGSYGNVKRIFDLTDANANSPEIAELAEAFGMMSTKVEAREFALERKVEELRQANLALEKASRAREEAGRVFILFALFIGFYNITLAIVSSRAFQGVYGAAGLQWAGILYLVCLVGICAYGIWQSGLPLSEHGLNLSNAGASLRESLWVTLPLLAGLAGFKFWAVRHLPAYEGQALVNLGAVDVFLWLYIVSAPVQEFIARGAIQSAIERTMAGRHRGAWAVLTSSVLFAACHVHYSLPMATSSLLAGLIWGALYLRHRTILGISLSHFLIGSVGQLLEIKFLSSPGVAQ
jgi:hypothetical protein